MKKESNKNKIAIIASGGGMKCSWGAGDFSALALEHGFTQPDILICASGSAGTGAYFTAGQYEDIRRIWLDFLSSKQMVNLWRVWKILNVDYLVDDVFQKQAPLVLENMRKSSIDFFISTFDVQKEQVKYFSNHQKVVDFFDILKASKSVPLVSGFKKPMQIENRFFRDSFFSSYWKTHLPKAVAEGANKILVFDHSTFDSLENTYDRLFLFLKGKEYKDKLLKRIQEVEHYKLPPGIDMLIVRPDNLRNHRLDNSPSFLQEAFDFGYQQVKNNKEIKDFLFK